MIRFLRTAVISDTDILVHLVKSGLFFTVMPKILKQIIIPTQVETELERSHVAVYAQLKPFLEKGDWLIRSSAVWKQASKEQRVEINQIKSKMRAQLDPGELDCYAYSVGFNIDAVISNDKGAKETIQHDSKGRKVVLSFADLFILGAKKDLLSWGEAGEYYDTVVRKCGLVKMPPFSVQVRNFETHKQEHPWVQEFLATI